MGPWKEELGVAKLSSFSRASDMLSVWEMFGDFLTYFSEAVAVRGTTPKLLLQDRLKFEFFGYARKRVSIISVILDIGRHQQSALRYEIVSQWYLYVYSDRQSICAA